MRAALFVLLWGYIATAAAEEKQPATAYDRFFEKCSKLLKYGKVNEFYDPEKADAVKTLGLLGDARAVPLLIEHLENEKNANLRLNIVKALGWIKSPHAVAALEKSLKDPDEYVRKGAA